MINFSMVMQKLKEQTWHTNQKHMPKKWNLTLLCAKAEKKLHPNFCHIFCPILRLGNCKNTHPSGCTTERSEFTNTFEIINRWVNFCNCRTPPHKQKIRQKSGLAFSQPLPTPILARVKANSLNLLFLKVFSLPLHLPLPTTAYIKTYYYPKRN